MKRMLHRRAVIFLLKGDFGANLDIYAWPKEETFIPHTVWARIVATARRLPTDEWPVGEVHKRLELLRKETCRADWIQAVTDAYVDVREKRPELADDDVEAAAHALAYGATLVLEPDRKPLEIPGLASARWGVIEQRDEDGG